MKYRLLIMVLFLHHIYFGFFKFSTLERMTYERTCVPLIRNGPDLVQAFPKKWWIESDFTAPNLPLPLRLKGFGCHCNSIFNNTER
jgi:hypothetical protein